MLENVRQVNGTADGITYHIDSSTAVVYRHTTAFSLVVVIGKKLIHEIRELEAAVFEDASFPILCEYYIFWG